jgi:opacity protein-like surface antigen
MRNALAVGLLFATFGIVPLAKAQEEPSKLELYGGYDYVRYNANPRISGVPPSESYNAHGASVQADYNPTKWLGLVADFSGYVVARQGFSNTHQVSYLFGPRIMLRRGRFTPFVQVLPGRAWAEDGITLGTVSAFAMTVGGGADVRVSRHVSIRPIQAEYFLTRFSDGNNNRQNNFRFGTGIIFRFGGK